MNAILEIEALEVCYGSAVALIDINIKIEQSQIIGIVGPNGAGKTTLLKTIAGLLRPSRGRIIWKGREMTRATPHLVTSRGIAHVPEGRRLIADLTVLDNLRLGAVGAGLSPHNGIEQVLQIFPPVADLLARRAGELSGGQQQMVAIGRGLMARPQLMMIDELSLGLAPKITLDLLRALERLSRDEGLTVLLVDQNVRLLSRYAAKLFEVSHGQITALDRSKGIENLDTYFAERQATR